MESQEGSGNVPRWENMNKDILSNIFMKLDVVDVIMGASRVCITWFLAAHNKTIWNTINLYGLDSIVCGNPCGPYLQDNDRGKHQYELTSILTEINKFSRTVPINVFISVYCSIQDEDLAIISERMPNIRKLALPVRGNVKLSSIQSAFSKWKNLQTLITAQYQSRGDALRLEFQAIGDKCTSVKFLRMLDNDLATNIICYLPFVEKLSFRGAIVSREAAISLIIGLPKLKILNLSHCIFTQLQIDGKTNEISNMKPMEELVKIGTEKLDDNFMVCCSDCPICPNVWKLAIVHRRFTHEHRIFWEREFKTDEIKEFEF